MTAWCAARSKGPDNPLLKRPEKVRADFVAHIDASHTYAKIVIGTEERLLRVGEWSDWVPVQFELPWGRLQAQCRFYLKQLAPEFVLYVSPLNLDPLAPALPVSTPGDVRSGPGARHRAVLHAGHARGHQGPQDGRADGIGVPPAGADRRR